MFGREFQAGEHRQHVLPPSPTRYAFERAENQRLTASRKQARPSESDLLSIVKGIAVSVGFSNARSMKNYDGSYFASLGRDYELFVTPTGRDNGYDWSVERKGSGVVREGYGMTSQEIVEDIRGSGVVASHKEAAQRTAFLDGFEVPEVRHRVAGWDWDDHLNGFLAAEAAREFTCACGEAVPAPGYTDCRCGKRWNCYQVKANGTAKFIAREVPVRENVVMASRALEDQVSLFHDGMDSDT